jgi:8-oxo-dGTP pyrophosphatase MutT (NUDIX family)
MIVYTGDGAKRRFMVAKKNEVAAWRGSHGGKFEDWKKKDSDVPLPAPITNNPRQYVFPGGSVETENNETLQKAAIREFREETGVNLSDFKPEQDVRRYFTCDDQGTVVSTVSNKPDNYNFGVVYAKFDEKAFETIKKQVDTNLSLNKPLHDVVERHYSRLNTTGKGWRKVQDELQDNCNFSKQAKNGAVTTIDDELDSVYSLDFKTARNTIQSADEPNGPQEHRTNWFVKALDECEKATTASASPLTNPVMPEIDLNPNPIISMGSLPATTLTTPQVSAGPPGLTAVPNVTNIFHAQLIEKKSASE